MIGTIVGEKYRVLRRLGAGEIGAVYEALHVELNARVAVKVLLAEHARRRDLLERFEREARAAGALVTPHIARVHDFGQERSSGLPFMVMELLEGEDLQQLIQRNGPLPWELVLKIAAQACAGLMAAHEQQIVHRDIKPANLFLARGPDGERTVKLLDFGVAKVIPAPEAGGVDAESLTRTGTMLGSPLYLSPEQARGQRDLDARADLWSLGVVLYKALTGRTPHQDTEALGELIITICTEAPPPIRGLAPWVPAEVAAVVHRALRLDPSERFQSAAEMRRAIDALVPGGQAILESMVRPLREAERAPVPDRPSQIAAHPGPAAKVDPPPATGAIAATIAAPLATMEPVQAPKAAPWWPLLLVAALATALGGGLAAYFLRGPAAETGPLPTESASAPARETRVMLVILPSAASVEIDGAPAKATDGVVELRGAPGTTRRVRVSAEGRAVTRDVRITESGASPAKIDLGSAAPAPR
ncbi:MAG: serine/threonine-protein kinase [Byssovorax sp.]